MIARALGADMVLADLRAGVTEFSAPFLFDMRVQKFFVTSTSMQSIKGTQMLLKEIHQKMQGSLLNSKVLLTMIPQEMEENTITQIEDELLETMETEISSKNSTLLRGDYLIEEKLADRQILNNNYNEILSFIEQTHSLTEWTQKWTELITLMAGGRWMHKFRKTKTGNMHSSHCVKMS